MKRSSELKTKKNRKKNINKAELWNTFSNEIIETKQEPIECVFRSCGCREKCDICESRVELTEEGFMACSNKTCGVIYRDMVDQSCDTVSQK